MVYTKNMLLYTISDQGNSAVFTSELVPRILSRWFGSVFDEFESSMNHGRDVSTVQVDGDVSRTTSVKEITTPC